MKTAELTAEDRKRLVQFSKLLRDIAFSGVNENLVMNNGDLMIADSFTNTDGKVSFMHLKYHKPEGDYTNVLK
jgi:hypothetical protein